jgi:FdhD protein
MQERPGSKVRTKVVSVEGDRTTERTDELATEEPLEIRLLAGGRRRTVAVTMRTPGHDFELTAGFLYSEGIVARRSDISGISYCVDRDVGEDQRFNVVNVAFAALELPDLAPLERHFMTSSSCGVCGKASIDALHIRGCPRVPDGPEIEPGTLEKLPDALRSAQGVFAATGGLHAAALFTHDGELIAAREDVGRHNAVDKLTGWALMNDRLPLWSSIGLVSGRASFEIVQKFLAAGVPVVAAVSAPSSLAVSTAADFNMTLIGFLRAGRFNVYAGSDRIVVPGLVTSD